MPELVTVYWVCFGVGLVYVLLAGALGGLAHGLAGAHSGDAGGIEFDHSLGEIHSADLNSENQSGQGGALDHGGHLPGMGGGHDTGMPDYNPFSLISLMGALAGFGAAGLIGANYKLPMLAGLGVAAGGALLMAALLWLLIGKLLYSLHSSSEAHVSDMIGLEAEVLTPIDPGTCGEIAYVLDGTRYTAPARLIHEGSVGRADKVRIRKVGSNLVYVEEKRKLLS
jgi:hypothetical protein